MKLPITARQLQRALLGLNAASLGKLLHAGPRHFMRACGLSYLAVRDSPTDTLARIPEVDLEEILGARQPVIQMPVRQYENGVLPNYDLLALLSILVAEAPREVLEIGTYMGNTTRQMAENLPHGTVHTVDLPEDFSPAEEADPRLPKDDLHLIRRRVVGREFKESACASRIRQHFADTVSWDFAEAGRPTFFFIDGAHTYEYCQSDSEKCLALCGGRGVFLWHDCDTGHPGVIRFLDEWRRGGRDIRRITGTALAYWKSE
ncbi:MAG: class I SAM-dependent methyltransferase [Chthoniobacter sp.]